MIDSLNLKVVVFLQICFLISSGLCQGTYDRKYDYFDIDTLVQNPRLLQKYMDCFLDKGPCTPIGRVFKSKYSLLLITLYALPRVSNGGAS